MRLERFQTPLCSYFKGGGGGQEETPTPYEEPVWVRGPLHPLQIHILMNLDIIFLL